MLASLARLVKISNCNNDKVRGSGTLEGSVETIQKCAQEEQFDVRGVRGSFQFIVFKSFHGA